MSASLWQCFARMSRPERLSFSVVVSAIRESENPRLNRIAVTLKSTTEKDGVRADHSQNCPLSPFVLAI